MNEDNFLKDLLAGYHPQLTDDRAFMQRLRRQMELADRVRAYQQEQRRTNRRFAAITFVAGLVLGCAVVLVMFLVPNPAEALLAGVKSRLLVLLLQNVQYAGWAIGAAIVCGSFLLIARLLNNRNELREQWPDAVSRRDEAH